MSMKRMVSEKTRLASGRGQLLLVLAMSLLAVFYVQYPALVDRYRMDDDFRQYYWMERFVDPDLFPNDYLLSNVKGIHELRVLNMDLLVNYTGLGVSLLYKAASYLMRPIVFNKILPFGLMLISVFYLFRLGRTLKDETTGFFLALLFIVFNLSASLNISVLPGLERSFCFPLLIVFLYYFVQEAPIASALSLAVQTVFYFPVFVVSVATYVLSLILFKGRRPVLDLTRRRLLPLVLGVILGVLLFSPALLSTAGATPAYPTDIPVWENPRYSQDGRIPIFVRNTALGLPIYLIMGYGGLATYLDIANMVPLLLTLMTMVATMGFRELRFPPKVVLLLLGSLSAWGLCWILALVSRDFLLRYPFKYTSAALPLFLLVAVAYNAEPFSDAVARLWSYRKGRSGLLLAGLGALLVMIAALTFSLIRVPFLTPIYQQVRIIGIGLGGILYILGINQLALLRLRMPADATEAPSIPDRARWMALGTMSLILILSYGLRMCSLPTVAEAEERDVYQFVSTLPKDVLLAGDPFQMSNVPPFSRRSVLFSEEIMDAGDDRILDFFDAYYAESWESVVSFCQKYDVDYLVVNQEQFSSSYLAQGHFFYVPYNETIAQTVAARSNFVLPQIPDSRKAFQSGPLFVVKCEEETFANLD